MLAAPAAVGAAIAVGAGSPLVAAGTFLALPVAGGLVLLLPISLAVRAARWHVDPAGIGGPNNWLVHYRLEWAEIESVVAFPIPGYRYVHVNGGGRR
jgi:hypothetical protein